MTSELLAVGKQGQITRLGAKRDRMVSGDQAVKMDAGLPYAQI